MLQGLTALDYALQENYNDCAEALRAAGAINGPAAVLSCNIPATVEVTEQLEPIADCEFTITPAVEPETAPVELPAVTDFAITYHFGRTSQFIDPEAGCMGSNEAINKVADSPIRSYVGQIRRTPAPKLAIGPLADELVNAAVVETAVAQNMFIAPAVPDIVTVAPVSAFSTVPKVTEPTEPVAQAVVPQEAVVASKVSNANYQYYAMLFAAVLVLIFFLISAWMSSSSSSSGAEL
jgi:hypothetical protein